MSKPLLIPVMAALAAWSAIPALADELPPGPGQETVAAVCGGCHDVNRIKVGYTPGGWHTVIRMMQNVQAPVPADQWPVVMQYLISNFPERSRPAAKILPAPAEVDIKEWPVPTPGSRPHDPLATADGAIWYSGQLANVLGRLDPKTANSGSSG